MLSKRYVNDGISCLELNSVQRDQKNRIQAHIDSGRYQFATTPCLVCGGDNYEQLSEKDRYGLYLPVAICRDCGLIQASPRMTEESYNHFYNDGHRRLYVGTEKPTDSYFNNRYRAGKSTFKYLSKHMDISNKRILEVGCGSGAILKYLHDHGAVVTGIDLSREYLKYGKERYGLDLSNTNLFELPDNKEFDLIIYSDVLEHIIDPHKHLEKIKRLLKPNGLLYIKVPSTKNIMRPYLGDFLRSLQNAHIYYFSLTTLSNLLRQCGFNRMHGTEEVRGLWGIATDKNNNQIENDYEPCSTYLRNIEKHTIVRSMLSFTSRLRRKIANL